MKIAVLGDTHFGCRNDSMIFHNYFRTFYEEIFFPYLKTNHIKHIVQVGDIFDRRKFINFKSLHESIDYFFSKLVENGITMDLLVGNHDSFLKQSLEINSPELLLGKYKKNIRIHSKPSEVVLGGMKALMVPWICEANEIEIKNAIATTEAQVMFGHLELLGFQMHKGMYSFHGTKPGNTFDHLELVITGHYHTKSSLNNIHYVGTPTEITWADHADQKGFHILDTQTLELDFIENENYLFYTVSYDDSLSYDSYEDFVSNVKFHKFEGKFLKLVIKCKNDPAWFDLFLDDLAEANVHHLQIVEDSVFVDTEYDEEILANSEDTIAILSNYVEQLDIKDDEKKAVDAVIKQCYDNAIVIM